ncbi:MAG: hypothetical protein AB1390_09935, partial [Nitrospirota bacterium]
NIILTCISIYAIVKFYKSRKGLWLILSGFFAAAGYYVRESALIIPLTAIGFLILLHKGRFREVTKSFGVFLFGYLSFLSLGFFYYTEFMDLNDFIASLTPLGLLFEKIENLISVNAANVITPIASSEPRDMYYNYILDAVFLHSFLFIGLGFSIIVFGRRLFAVNKGNTREKYLLPHSILYLWVFLLFIAYAYQFHNRGFFIDYFREFLPPLVIIFAVWLKQSIPLLEREGVLERFLIGCLLISGSVFLLQAGEKQFFKIGLLLSLTFALFTLFFFIKSFRSSFRQFVYILILLTSFFPVLISYKPVMNLSLSRPAGALMTIALVYASTFLLLSKRDRTVERYAMYSGHSLVLGAFIVSLNLSAMTMDLKYDNVWSPESVKETAAYLKAQTDVDDEILSGAVIWELQANRRPFQSISHPLKFIFSISQKEKECIIRGLRTSPPKVIILDGYTEKTYIHQIPWIAQCLETGYALGSIAGPARHPVRIYQLCEKFCVSEENSRIPVNNE